MVKFDYDMLVLGGGAGGLTAAKTACGFGKHVAIVEITDRLGGECTWTGCVPSKTLIKTAEVAYHAKHMNMFGLRSNEVNLDTSEVMDHVRSVVREVYKSHTPADIEAEGISVLFGAPQFIDNYTIELNGKRIIAKQFVITTGSSPFVPPIEGIDTVDYLTNENLFDLKTLPKSMIILGGGPIGAEMASALNRLGVEIIIIEMQDRIMPREDEELVSILVNRFNKEGVTIVTGMRATKVEKKGDTILVLCIDKKDQQHTFAAEQILIAVGRRPNIEKLSLDNAGVQISKKGIVVDNTLRTTAQNIYAAGDVVGPYLFSHIAWYHAITAVRNAFIPFFKKRINYEHIIWVTFTAPELARAGLTETEAREKYGDSLCVYRIRYDQFDRGHTDRARVGFAKIICNKKGSIIGAHIIGERAGDIIHELQLAKTKGIPFHELQSIIHAYPTYAELNWHAAKRAYLDHLDRNMLIKLMKRLFIKRK